MVDTPALQLMIAAAVGAGGVHMVIVTSRRKPAIEAYFQPQPEVIAKLRSSGRDQMADRVEALGRDVKVSFAYQDQALGLGHAVGCARDVVGDEPFAVLLPDELMGSSSLLDQMARLCEATNGSVVGLKEVPHDEVSAYGVIDPSGELDDKGVIPVKSMVEKPKPADAPSNLIIIGRYVLTPDVFDEIANVKPGAGGEIQLTDALKAQAARSPFHGVVQDVLRYDTGNPFGWLTANIEIGLADPQLGPQLRTWLQGQLA